MKNVLFVICFLLAYVRLFVGVDFTDEAYSVGMSYMFAVGQRPWIDEMLPHQGAAILIWPPIQAFLKITDSTTGLMLFARHVFFFLNCGFSYFLYRVFKNRFSPSVAAVLASFNTLYMPFSIPLANYNFLGSLFLSVALLLNHLGKSEVFILFLGAIFSSLAIFVYPTMSVPISLSYLTLIFHEKEALIRTRIFVLAFLAVGMAIILFSIFGFNNFFNIIQINRSVQIYGGGLEKIRNLYRQLSSFQWIYFSLFVGLIIATTRFTKAVHRSLLIIAQVLLLIFLIVPSETFYISLIFPFFIILFAVYFYLQKYIDMYVPIGISVVAGLVTSYTSANGLSNFGIGAYPGLIVIIGLILRQIEIQNDSRIAEKFGLVFILPLIYFNLMSAYRDSPPLGVTHRIESQSPYWGIWTQKPKYDLHEKILNLIHAATDKAQTVFFYDFPVGYMMAGKKPVTNATWLLPQSIFPLKESIYISYLDGKRPPDVAFIFNWSNFPEKQIIGYDIKDSWPKFLESYFMVRVGNREQPFDWVAVYSFSNKN